VTDADVPDGDVVIATWWETAEWVAGLSASKGEKHYFIQGYEISDWWPAERVHATYRLPMRKMVVSRWLVDIVRSSPDEVIPVVEHGLDHTQFHAPPRGKQPLPTVGMLYSRTAFKGVEVAFRAVELARQALPELGLVAFGADKPRSELPLPARTCFAYRPPQQRLREIYAHCDVWLCASWREGFHLPPLEAMACRCPVVSTAVGGPRDIVEPGLNGYLTSAGDAPALARYLVKIATLPEEDWRAMSDRALTTASRYSWEKSVAEFEAALLGRSS
jgi:glycosyltransferase involved in cell wall biosynthesis